MKTTTMLGSIKTTFGATAIAAATVLALGSTSSPANAGSQGPQVSASAGECKAGGECVVYVQVKVTEDGIHVNTEYNHKVTANEAGVTFLGKTKPALFSRDDGDFETKGEKIGQVKVRFKPASKGKVTIAGTYKYATCADKGGGCTPGSGGFSVDVTVK